MRGMGRVALWIFGPQATHVQGQFNQGCLLFSLISTVSFHHVPGNCYRTPLGRIWIQYIASLNDPFLGENAVFNLTGLQSAVFIPIASLSRLLWRDSPHNPFPLLKSSSKFTIAYRPPIPM